MSIQGIMLIIEAIELYALIQQLRQKSLSILK